MKGNKNDKEKRLQKDTIREQRTKSNLLRGTGHVGLRRWGQSTENAASVQKDCYQIQHGDIDSKIKSVRKYKKNQRAQKM